MDSVLVVMPTYNGEDFIKEAIDSVINQSYKNIDLLVVDDGSTDKTIDIVQSYINKNLARIKLIQKCDGIKGAPSSRNLGILNSTNKFVAFIDQDDKWNSQKIEKQIIELKRTNTVLNYTDIEIIDVNSIVKKEAATKENLNRLKNIQNMSRRKKIEYVVRKCPIRIGTVLMRTSVYKKLSGFNAQLFGGEDWDFWVRFVIEGNNFSYLNESLAYRRIHSNNVSINFRSERVVNWMKAAKEMSNYYPDYSSVLYEFIKERVLYISLQMILNGNKESKLKLDDGLIKNDVLSDNEIKRINDKLKIMKVVWFASRPIKHLEYKIKKLSW